MKELQSDTLHHAYLIVGAKSVIPELLKFFEKDLSFRTQGNPDFWMSRHETFTIDDARALSDLHLRKPLTGDRKLFVLSASGITAEAQNALLKLFEEPIPGNHFFLILPESKTILPTLLSRVFLISPEPANKDDSFGKRFLAASLGERLKLISGIVESKDRVEARSLIRSLINHIRSQAKDEKMLIRMTPVLEDLIKSDDYLSDRSPSVKMVLEHIAHVAPRV